MNFDDETEYKKNYLTSLKIGSYSANQYLYYFKNRLEVFVGKNSQSESYLYQGFICKNVKIGNYANCYVTDTPAFLVGVLTSFNERQWLAPQSLINLVELKVGRDAFNPSVNIQLGKGSIQISREPLELGTNIYNLGGPIRQNPYIQYRSYAIESELITAAEMVRYRNSGTLDRPSDVDILLDRDSGSERSRAHYFNFIERAYTSDEQAKTDFFRGNLKLNIFEDSQTIKGLQMYFTPRRAKDAGNTFPYIQLPQPVALSFKDFRICAVITFVEMPQPTISEVIDGRNYYKDYTSGYSQSVLFYYIIDTKTGTSYPLTIQLVPAQDESFFYLEKYEDNSSEWFNGTVIGEKPDQNDGGKFIGYLPNFFDYPVIIGTSKGFYIYISGKRSHYSARDQGNVYATQTAVLKTGFDYLENTGQLAFSGTNIIEHDASGSPSDYSDFGGTDNEFWNVYATLWGGNVNDKAVVLVSNTRLKRFADSAANYAGEKAVEDIANPDDNLETYFHIYIDDEVFKYDTASLGFGPNLDNDEYIVNSHKYVWNLADINNVAYGKKYGTVISDTEILFCFRNYPEHTENLIVKFNIESKNFDIIKRYPKSDGEIVITCYQKRITNSSGNTTMNSGLVIRIGKQGQSGTVYINKDGLNNFIKVAESNYTSGGGLYFIGNQFYGGNYGNFFK